MKGGTHLRSGQPAFAEVMDSLEHPILALEKVATLNTLSSHRPYRMERRLVTGRKSRFATSWTSYDGQENSGPTNVVQEM